VNLTNASSSYNSNYTVEFAGAEYVTFKDMTISATGNSYGRVLYFPSGSDYITLDNCELVGVNANTTSTYMAIVYSDYGSLDNNTTFRDCGIREGSYGMYLYGGGSNSTESTVAVPTAPKTMSPSRTASIRVSTTRPYSPTISVR